MLAKGRALRGVCGKLLIFYCCCPPDINPLFCCHAQVCNSGGTSTLREIDPPYMYSSRQARLREKERRDTFAKMASSSSAAALPAAPAAPAAAPAPPAEEPKKGLLSKLFS